MLSSLLSLTAASVRPLFFTAFWFCMFFGPLYYLLPHVGWNPWWAILVGTAGATVYVIQAIALAWYAQQEQAA
ncbi:hypothetical protein [Pseudaestuariivita sp.]|uniref:hypothetical protein n=1 Tax=Pseudaestuariivita sp. TaxID=2211669 RepID=UPI004059237E